jgi:hypothetical protein
VDDDLILEVAHRAKLEHITIKGTPRVTDIGLGAAAMQSPKLRTLSVAGTSPTETFGIFLSKVLALRQLEFLELKTPMLNLQDYQSARRQCAAAPRPPLSQVFLCFPVLWSKSYTSFPES